MGYAFYLFVFKEMFLLTHELVYLTKKIFYSRTLLNVKGIYFNFLSMYTTGKVDYR